MSEKAEGLVIAHKCMNAAVEHLHKSKSSVSILEGQVIEKTVIVCAFILPHEEAAEASNKMRELVQGLKSIDHSNEQHIFEEEPH